MDNIKELVSEIEKGADGYEVASICGTNKEVFIVMRPKGLKKDDVSFGPQFKIDLKTKKMEPCRALDITAEARKNILYKK